jgi:serine/threonine protein kinase
LNEEGHGKPVDWWGLGILLYEMIVGFPPFYTGNSTSNDKMFNMIKSKKVVFPDPVRHKINMSDECKDFITKLLNKNPDERLGTKTGIQELQDHPFFESINFDDLLNKKNKAPFIPKLSAN